MDKLEQHFDRLFDEVKSACQKYMGACKQDEIPAWMMVSGLVQVLDSCRSHVVDTWDNFQKKENC